MPRLIAGRDRGSQPTAFWIACHLSGWCSLRSWEILVTFSFLLPFIAEIVLKGTLQHIERPFESRLWVTAMHTMHQLSWEESPRKPRLSKMLVHGTAKRIFPVLHLVVPNFMHSNLACKCFEPKTNCLQVVASRFRSQINRLLSSVMHRNSCWGSQACWHVHRWHGGWR